MSQLISPMLRLFRDGIQDYQPEISELTRETGDPQISYENVERLLAAGLLIQHILVCPTGTLFYFSTGEQFYAPGLRVGVGGRAPEALAQIAAKARFGPFDRLLRHCRALPEDYDGPLLPLISDPPGLTLPA